MTLAEARDARFAAKKDVAAGDDDLRKKKKPDEGRGGRHRSLSKKTNAQTVCR